MVYFLGEDSRRRLWIGTGDGVDVVTSQGIDHFDDSDGLAGNDASAKAFMADDDGSVWLGEGGGATHVFAQDYDGPPQAPRMMILAGRLGDHPIHGASAGLEVPHDQNTLTLELASSSLLDETRLRYEVRLTPMESEWSATRQREARYPGLVPGSYRFEVRARIGVGDWGPVASLGFAILPAWWQTRSFFVVVGLSGLLGIGAGFAWWLRRRTRQLHARAEASFHAVVDLMPDMISVHRHRKLNYLNLAHRRFLGVDGPGTWEHIQLIDRIHPDDRTQTTEMFLRVRPLDPELALEVIEIRMRAADGSWRICEVSGIIVEIAGALTVVATGRDVTER
jgi:PAS domain S-box-containing protein